MNSPRKQALHRHHDAPPPPTAGGGGRGEGAGPRDISPTDNDSPPVTGLAVFALASAEFAALAAFAVVPLYFNPRTARVFEPDKLAWLIVLALAAALGLAVWAAETWPAWRTSPRRLPPLLWVTVMALLAVALGTLGSSVPAVSLWGAYRRGQSLWAYAAYGVLFASIALTARRPGAMARFWRIAQAVAIPVALYALFQRFEIDSLEWDIYGSSPAERAFGPLGNPIFLGAYLAMVAPLALAGLAAARAGRQRGGQGGTRQAIGSGAVLGLALAGLIAAESRGPLLGMAIGLGVFAILWAAATGRRRWALGIVGIGCVGAAAMIAAAWLEVPGSQALTASRTAQERLLLWEGLGQLLADDPVRAVIGYGPETTSFVVSRYLPDALIQLTPVQFFDRAHNVLWEWWISAGIAGVLGYLLLYVLAFQAGYRRLGLAPDRAAAWRLAGLMLGGALVGLVAPIALGSATMAALGAPAGLLVGAAVHAAVHAASRRRPAGAGRAEAAGRADGSGGKRGRREAASPPLGTSPPLGAAKLLTIGILSALSAHLIEASLGLPTAAGEVLFWGCLGLLVALAAPSRGSPQLDDGLSAAAANPLADGLLDGLALAAIFFAPILLPSVAQTWAAWPILLLVPAYWIGADLLSWPGEGPQRRGQASVAASARRQTGSAAATRAAARIGVLLAFGCLFVLLQGRPGGEMVAFALTLVGVTLAGGLSLARARPARAASAPWRWISYASLGILALIGAWWLALRPVLADFHIRAGQEAEAVLDRAGARAHYETAIGLWPEQPVYASFLVGILRQEMTRPELAESERALVFDTARASLERAWSLAPDNHYAQDLGVLYRDRGDLVASDDGGAQWWREAALHFEQALAVHPRSPGTLFEYAGLLERMGQLDAAGQTYADAFSLNQGNFEAAAGAMRVALAQGDVAGADAVLRDATARDPEGLRLATENRPEPPIDALRSDQARVMILARHGDIKAARELLGALPTSAVGASGAADDPATERLEIWLRELAGGG